MKARALAAVALLSSVAPGQQYVISTYAGGAPPLLTPAPGINVSIDAAGVATDAAGNVYFASADCVFKLDASGVLTRVAGNSRPGYSGDGGPATNARFRLRACCLPGPAAVAVDRAGNLFIADTENHRIRKVLPSGIIVTVAGNGTRGFSGNGGPATSAQLNWPMGVAVDGVGNLFIADRGNNHVRKASTSGIITTVAGGGTVWGSSGDGGPATSAALEPEAVAVDGAGNVFLVDGNSWDSRARVRKVSASGIITTVAGNGIPGFSGDGGPAATAQLTLIGSTGLAVDGESNLFIADGGNRRVRKVSPSGIITTVAGNGINGFSGDGGPATSARLEVTGVAVDTEGNLFIAAGNRIRRVSPNGIITTVAGGGTSGFLGDGGPATSAQLGPSGVAVDGAGNLFIADGGHHRVRKVSSSGTITTVAGNGAEGFAGDGGPATGAQLSYLHGVALDGAGNLFVADRGNRRIRKVSPVGIITTVAGNGTSGSSGDGGPATEAPLGAPLAVAVDQAGNLFIADGNQRIRKVSPDGIITTAAGNGTTGFSGDGGPATSAQLSWPAGVAVDAAGNLFIADFYNARIRRVSPSGIITTVAGGGDCNAAFQAGCPPIGDGGPAIGARLHYPSGVAVDGAGNLFIATSDDDDLTNEADRIRKVSPSGIITTVAGTGVRGFTGDGGSANTAELASPSGLAVDAAGNLYVADAGNNAVRILRPIDRSVWIGAAVDAASQRADPVSPGKIVVIYGAGLGPSELIRNQPSSGVFSTELGGTRVSFNGIAAPILYTSVTQVAAIAPYALTGTTAQVTVTYQGEVSAALTVPGAASAPSLFTLNQAGWGQAAAINAADGTVNTAANPVRIGGYISLYATGEGQTAPTGVDGRIAGSALPRPVLPVSVTVGGIPATVQYQGGAPGLVAGLMQVNVQIPNGVQPRGYVPVVLRVGERSSSLAVWIAVGN